MNDIYLTKELKEYYLDDFVRNLIPCANPSWKLDGNLLSSLKKINVNPNIQTLYSKRSSFTNPIDNSSYLEFTYFREVELVIFREIFPPFVTIFNDGSYGTKCIYAFNPPMDNSVFSETTDSSCLIGCRVNPDYFRVNHVKITLEANDPNLHEKFWKRLEEELSAL